MPDDITPNIEADTPSASGESQLPSGVGLSLDDLRTLLATRHNTLVDKDDPMLMVGTLLNAYLGEVEKQNQRLQKGMAKLLADKTDGYVQGVQAGIDSLTQSLSTASVEAIKQLFTQNAQHMERFKTGMWLAAAIVATSAIMNVAVFVVLALKR